MKRLVVMAIMQVCGKAILLTLIGGIVIGIIGYLSKWNASLAYSNAFFIAGVLAMGAGAMSRLSAGQDRNQFQLTHAESFRDMSASEQANLIVKLSSSTSQVILFLSTGILLILISVFIPKMF